MKTKLLALLLGTSVILGACGGAEEPNEEAADTTEENQGDAGETANADAEAIVQQNCISCHGQNLEGGAAPNLTEVGSKYSKDEIKDIILNGQGGMPAGILDEPNADTVAAWLAEKK